MTQKPPLLIPEDTLQVHTSSLSQPQFTQPHGNIEVLQEDISTHPTSSTTAQQTVHTETRLVNRAIKKTSCPSFSSYLTFTLSIGQVYD